MRILVSLREDIGGVPDDVRTAVRDANEALQRAARERPIVSYALDLRIVLAAAGGALVVALVLRLLGLPSILALIVFLLVLGGLWAGLAGAAAPRPPTSR
jgi:hypothetical protein